MSFQPKTQGDGKGIELDSSAVQKPKLQATQNEVSPTAQFSLKRKRDGTDISATDMEGNGPPAVKKPKIHADQKDPFTAPDSLKRVREDYESVAISESKGNEDEAVPPAAKKLKIIAPKDKAPSPNLQVPRPTLVNLMQFPILRVLMAHLTDEDAVNLQLLNSNICAELKSNAPQSDVRGWAGLKTCQKMTSYLLAGKSHSSQCRHPLHDRYRCKGLPAPFTALPAEQHRLSNLCDPHHDDVAREFAPQIHGLASNAQQGLCHGCEEKYWSRYQRSGREAWTCGCGNAYPMDNRCRACYVDLLRQMEAMYEKNIAEGGEAEEGDVKCFCGQEHDNHGQWRVYGCYICRKVNVRDFENEV